MADNSAGVFLTAEWRYLAMLNYVVDPALLAPLVPRGTELDEWAGQSFVSVVGFLFRNTRLRGLPVPLHRNFEELNLRFYVRRVVDGEIRRGVVFVREVVPRVAISTVARLAYNEPYRALPMRHVIDLADSRGEPRRVEYGWRLGGAWNTLAVAPQHSASRIGDGSHEEFIAEHYWGYTRQRDGGTVEYEVRHPRWNVWQAERATLDGDLEALYGRAFADALHTGPTSAFLADGSAVSVHAPHRIC